VDRRFHWPSYFSKTARDVSRRSDSFQGGSYCNSSSSCDGPHESLSTSSSFPMPSKLAFPNCSLHGLPPVTSQTSGDRKSIAARTVRSYFLFFPFFRSNQVFTDRPSLSKYWRTNGFPSSEFCQVIEVTDRQKCYIAATRSFRSVVSAQ
jgi:hypothetical protein